MRLHLLRHFRFQKVWWNLNKIPESYHAFTCLAKVHDLFRYSAGYINNYFCFHVPYNFEQWQFWPKLSMNHDCSNRNLFRELLLSEDNPGKKVVFPNNWSPVKICSLRFAACGSTSTLFRHEFACVIFSFETDAYRQEHSESPRK